MATATPSSPAATKTATRTPTPTVRPTPTPTPTRVDPGPAWPQARRGPAPPALGAVITLRVAPRGDGGTLAAGLLLPRVGGSAAAPLVMTPCGDRTTLRAADVRAVAPGAGGVLPKAAAGVVVVIDPGHGGPALGSNSAGATPEKVRTLEVSREAAAALRGRVGRVYLTRDRDLDAVLTFRTTLADALRADVAVSVHFNGAPDGRLERPGLETYGSVADPNGRRLAGVIYAAQRRYLDTLGGPWVGDRDAGAKYRVNSSGNDFYGLLRRGHRPWVISESMFISEPREARLLARPDVRRGLGGAIAQGIVDFTTTRAPGSGWTRPYPRPASEVGGRGNAPACRDPAR